MKIVVSTKGHEIDLSRDLPSNLAEWQAFLTKEQLMDCLQSGFLAKLRASVTASFAAALQRGDSGGDIPTIIAETIKAHANWRPGRRRGPSTVEKIVAMIRSLPEGSEERAELKAALTAAIRTKE